MKIYKTEDELIEDLKDFSARFDKVVTSYKRYSFHVFRCPVRKNPPPNKELFRFNFDPTIARAFKHETPTQHYKNWYVNSINPDDVVSTLNKISSQEEYDEFIYMLRDSLVAAWPKLSNSGEPSRMTEGVAMKIINLLMKHICFLSPNIKNSHLKDFLHVPWDKFTLRPIRKLFLPYAREIGFHNITSDSSMGYVTGKLIYEQLHKFISDVCKKAGVPRVYYEFMTWDETHQD